MRYKVVMSDWNKDERIIKEVVADNVFDAIDIVAGLVDNPDKTELISATPV